MTLQQILSNAIKNIIKECLTTGTPFRVIIDRDLAIISPTDDRLTKIPNEFRLIPFDIVEYSLETFTIDDEDISFHYGDNDNVEHTVIYPVNNIVSIVIKENPIITNLWYSQQQEVNTNWKSMPTSEERSREMFMSNPQNKKFFNIETDEEPESI